MCLCVSFLQWGNLVHVGYAGYRVTEVAIEGTEMIFKMDLITGLERWLSYQWLGSPSNCQDEYDDI